MEIATLEKIKGNQGENHIFLHVCLVFLMCLKTNHVQIHQSTQLLSIFSLKLHCMTKTVAKMPFEATPVFYFHKYVTNPIELHFISLGKHFYLRMLIFKRSEMANKNMVCVTLATHY